MRANPLELDDAPTTTPARRLQPLYFLHNFRRALTSLSERYTGLLSLAETHFIQAFHSLDEPTQCLLTRLCMRKGPWFRRETLHYAEVPDLGASLERLSALGWLAIDPPLSAEDLFTLLNRQELRDTFGILPRSQPKVAWLAHCEMQLPLPFEDPPAAQRPLSHWNPRLANGFVRFGIEQLARRLQWLFFGNDQQEWSEFVLVDLGMQKFEPVPFDASSRAFQTRAEIEHFYRLNDCRARLRAGEAAASVREGAGVPEALDGWLLARFARLHIRIGEALAHEGASELAIQTYRACGSPDGLVKAVRLQERLGLYAAAQGDARLADQETCTQAQREAVDRALLRLGRRLGDEPGRPHARAKPEVLELIQPTLADGERVERCVATRLSTPESPVFYVENSLLTSLFGLLCWDALFAPLPGAFFHPFQRGPADLHTPQFRQRRAGQFDALLALLDTSEHTAVIRRHYETKAGIQTSFVRWGRLTLQLLNVALECIPAAHLRLWFERLLENVQDNCTGMPDLIQFWPAERRYRLIEVKAPGDRLQDNQRRWLAFFAEQQMPAAVCQVRWSCSPSPTEIPAVGS